MEKMSLLCKQPISLALPLLSRTQVFCNKSPSDLRAFSIIDIGESTKENNSSKKFPLNFFSFVNLAWSASIRLIKNIQKVMKLFTNKTYQLLRGAILLFFLAYCNFLHVFFIFKRRNSYKNFCRVQPSSFVPTTMTSIE